MSGSARIALEIDVFEKPAQPALALQDLTPRQLIASILHEFAELEYLGCSPEQYRLVKTSDGVALDEGAPIGTQVRTGERLVLVEVEAPLPAGTIRPSRPIYFREYATGTTYAVGWQPAIIGRSSENVAQNELVAVDLKGLRTGAMISRRHVRLTEEQGRFYVESISPNPLLLRRAVPEAPPENGADAGNQPAPLTPESGRREIRPGDMLVFERAGIELKLVVRPET